MVNSTDFEDDTPTLYIKHPLDQTYLLSLEYRIERPENLTVKKKLIKTNAIESTKLE